MNNLRLISAAKDQAALDLPLDNSATPTAAQIQPYLKGSSIPEEPVSGSSTSYTAGINAVSTTPACASSAIYTNHTL